MGGGGWHDAPWKGILAVLRGEKGQKPPIGYLPDRGAQKQRNHRWLGAAWHLSWLRRYGDGLEDGRRLVLVHKWATEATKQEEREGLGVHAGGVEVFMPDPHTAYDVLPRLLFLIDARERSDREAADRYRLLFRWQLFGWRAGSTPDGQVVLPCTRLVTPLSQVADACNRFLLDLPHRNNKWEARTWDQWWKLHKSNPNAQLWAAEYFRQALAEHGREGLLQLDSRPQLLEAPLLAWPIEVERTETGHVATMQHNEKYNGIAPCYRVAVTYGRKRKPTDSVTWSTDRVNQRLGVAKRMTVRGAMPV